MTRLYVTAAAANAWVLLAILAGAFASQILSGEPPCPLCVLQRIGMMLAAVGPCHLLMATRRGTLTERDIGIGAGMLLLGSLLGAAISLRQTALHILPGDPGFGEAVLGYHLYTWAFLVFVANMIAAALQLLGLPWFRPEPVTAAGLARVTSASVAVLFIANILSVIAEAGFAWSLPDDPVGYLLFQSR